jgi:hypothetical protein
MTLTPNKVIVFSTGAGVNGDVQDSYLNFAWTSVGGGGAVTAGAQIVLGQAVRRLTGTLSSLRAAVRVNNVNRFSQVYLSAIDVNNGANTFQSVDLSGSLLTSWTVLASAGFNPSAWSTNMAISLTVLGTTTAGNAGSTTLDVAWLDYTP